MDNPSKTVAAAICRVDKRAGQAHEATEQQSIEARAENLLRDGPYGPYIADGDPGEWGGPGTLATIYMEPRGGSGDCTLPLDYYGNGLDMSCAASNLLPGHAFIEFVNAAVAVLCEG